MSRAEDHERVANALALHPDDARIPPVVDLIEEVRHETIDACTKRVTEAVTRTFVLISNGAMTPERLRRLLEEG